MSILSRSRPGADADADAGPRDKVWPPAAAHRSDKLEKNPEIKEHMYKKEQPTLLAAHPSSHCIVKNPRPRTFITRRTVHPPSQSMQNLTMAQLSRAVPVNTRHVRLHNSHNSEMRNPSSITPWPISTSPSRGSRGQYCCRAYSVHRLCGVTRAYPACWQLLDVMLARSSRTEYSVGCSACAAFSHY